HVFIFLTRVRSLAKGLIASGIQPGDMIAVISRTSYQWALVDQAIWFAGAISVPIYETSSPSQIAHILGVSGAKKIFVAGTSQALDVSHAIVQLQLADIEQFYLTDAGLAELTTAGNSLPDDVVDTARKQATMYSSASVVYTSGTTCTPKGAFLSHGNLADGAVNIIP